MTSRRQLASYSVAAIWSIILVYSIIMVMPAVRGNDRRVLFFPDVTRSRQTTNGLSLIGEIRYLPYRESINDELLLLLTEVILGPTDHRVFSLLPNDTNIISAQVISDTIHLNLSYHALLGPIVGSVTGDERLQVISDMILFNFPRLKTVNILVEGQELENGNVGRGGNNG